ncbi:MAG: V-type ATP synthase subunit F [Oscillospiraceae bacterium]|nr:V-type ATP synthase subunit F [Oscillospiraceae bacterium]
MRYYLISDDDDALTGMRLAGIEGKKAQSRNEVEECIERVVADDSIAVMLITEKCARMAPSRIKSIKLSAHRPLVVTIPTGTDTGDGAESVTDAIRNAIGIKI